MNISTKVGGSLELGCDSTNSLANTSREDDYWSTRCGGATIGWFHPVSNPRVAVYLGLVVGLGFAFTENIQYGSNVYIAATEISRKTNVCVNIMFNPKAKNFTAIEEYLSKRDNMIEYNLEARETNKAPKSALHWPGISDTQDSILYIIEAWLFMSKWGPRSSASDFFFITSRRVGNTLMSDCAFNSTQHTWKCVKCKIDSLFREPKVAHRDINNRSLVVTAEEVGDDRNMAYQLSKVSFVQAPCRESPAPLNFTICRKPNSEEQKMQGAIVVTFSRGLLPLHAVWAGLTATRYVRSLWLQSDSLFAARSGQHRVDILRCLGFSWFYHGTFDFAIMITPAMMLMFHSSYVFVACLVAALTVALLSVIHLAQLALNLELDLTLAGWVPPTDGSPQPSLCTGVDI